MRIVQKYGGSSLADCHRVLAAARQVAALWEAGNEVVVVVSAQGYTTDRLLELGSQITSKPEERELDALLCAGEQMSAALMAMALQSLQVPAVSLSGWQMGLLTRGPHGNAEAAKLTSDRILRELMGGKVVVAAGFQGVNELGDVTTLGRGGSDTTAVALAAFLKADRCRICTDVDGVYDRDPRRYPDAVKYERIGYDHMLELCRNGARVLHDRCVVLAREWGVELEVLSTFRPGPGTRVAGI